MNNAQTTAARLARLSIIIARLLLTLALFALIGAWVTQLTGAALFGLSQQHLFNDAIALSLLGIGAFLDALWHGERKPVRDTSPLAIIR